MKTKKQNSLLNFAYIHLLCTSILISCLFYALIPILSEYTISGIGLDLSMAGLITGIFSIISILARPISGIISDTHDPKWLFLVSTASLGISIIGMYYSSNFICLLILRILQGIFYSFCGTSLFVLISQKIPAEHYNEGISYYGMGQILSSSLGMNIGLVFSNHLPIQFCSIIIGSIFIFVTGIYYLILSTPQYKTKNIRYERNKSTSFRIPMNYFAALLPFGLLGALFSASNGIETAFLPLLAQEREIPYISNYFTLYIIVLIFAKPVTGKLADRKGFRFILCSGLFLMILECLLIGSCHMLAFYLAAACLKAIGQGSAHPCLQAESIRKLGYEKSGTASSIFLLFTDLGQGMGPIIAGKIAASFSLTVVFLYSAILYSVAFILCLLFLKRKNKN